jgi:hypothetical protein
MQVDRLDWPVALLNRPTGHSKQFDLPDDVPYVPLPQGKHCDACTLPVVALKVPGGHWVTLAEPVSHQPPVVQVRQLELSVLPGNGW